MKEMQKDLPTGEEVRPTNPTVELVKSDYQPTKAELAKDVRVDATLEEAVKALTHPVKIRWINRPKPTG